MSSLATHLLSSFLAQAGAQQLPIERKRELVWLLLFVVAAGVTLLVVVMLLMRAWRRNVARLQAERKKLSAHSPDIWKAGGDRLIAKMSPFPKPSAPGSSDDTDDDDTDPEDDDDAPPPPTDDGPFDPDDDGPRGQQR